MSAKAEIPTDAMVEMFRRMVRIRAFEERARELYRDGEIPGFVHLSIGQEATAVGACWPLTDDDRITSNHRGHGHCLAKGLDMAEMFAELLGKETGTCRGRGGSMHIADPQHGILGANGIVGAGIPIGVGSAVASWVRGDDAVTVVFFGDGAVNTGSFHEAVNLAAIWRLPVIFFCENNHYAEFSRTDAEHPVPIIERARAYGIEAFTVSGTEVDAVATLTDELVARCRLGHGPFLVEADTYRWRGHYEGDPERYRTPEEVGEWQLRDPLELAAARLRERGIPAERCDAIRADADAEVEAAVEDARAADEPAPSTLHDFVTSPRPRVVAEPAPSHSSGSEPGPDDPEFRVMDAVREALEHELEADPDLFLMGIDIAEGGGVFGLTRGLHSRWPTRVLDTPISETALVGAAVGAAMVGLHPVVELMYLDFIGVCFDQIMNQAAKLRYMTGGKASLPITIRSQFGAGRSSGSQHSQSLEAMLAHIPGLTVVMPSTPADTYGLLRSSLQDPNPVIFIENRLLYGFKGPRPAADHLVPIGKAAVRRRGSDLTIVSWSRMVHDALAAAEVLATEGIDAEVIDLRTISPLDFDTVLESLARTSRLLVAHEAVCDFGVGAEIAAVAADQGFWNLDAPVVRVGAQPTPAPYAPQLEHAWLPDEHDIVAAARALAKA